MADQETTDTGAAPGPRDVEAPDNPSMELPAVILGDQGEEDEPKVRVLPGRVPMYKVLHPAYVAVAVAGVLATYFSLSSGEWHPLMVLVGWGLLFCWYWVYAVAYRYRRRIMKYFSLAMGTLTAASLTLAATVRGTSMAVPEGADLVIRSPRPLLFVVAGLTTLSLAAIFTHVIYLGRGYRQKAVNRDNRTSDRDRPDQQ